MSQESRAVVVDNEYLPGRGARRGVREPLLGGVIGSVGDHFYQLGKPVGIHLGKKRANRALFLKIITVSSDSVPFTLVICKVVFAINWSYSQVGEGQTKRENKLIHLLEAVSRHYDGLKT